MSNRRAERHFTRRREGLQDGVLLFFRSVRAVKFVRREIFRGDGAQVHADVQDYVRPGGGREHAHL